MIPYADFGYWGVLLYPTVPACLLSWSRRLRQAWLLIATLGMLAVQYSADRVIGEQPAIRECWLVLGFGGLQYALANCLLLVRRHTSARWAWYAVVVLALVPLIAARVLPQVAPTYQIGFIGLSYVTFRSLDVLVGIQDRLIRRLPPGAYIAYVLFFPTISAGPVDRYRRFVSDWLRSRTRAELIGDVDGAVHRVFTGLLYKFLLAELIRRYWMEPAAATDTLLGTIAYMYAYSLYLFFDFAGYSAFAIGVGYLFGIHTPENFNRPFLARDIRDFWNRWHISLSWWFRDHVYMRFVLAATRGNWFADRNRVSALGFFVSFGLMGLWHGFEPQYLVYGLYHATLLTGYAAFERWNKHHRLWGDGLVWRACGVFLTVQAVCFGFLIFSGHLPVFRPSV